MPGNMDPLGQVAQLLGVQKTAGIRGRDAATVEPVRNRRGDASLVNVSHSGSALADMAARLKAVGFVHNPNAAEQHEHRPPPGHGPERKSKKAGTGPEPRDEKPRHRLKRFAETDESRAERKARKKELSQAEVTEVRRLKELDGKVKAHEMAHKAAAGSLAAGGPFYEYEQGPDGVNYAVAGHVPIHVPETDDPEQALRDSEKAYRAALAPADPSSADRSAAAQFSARAAEARQQIANEKSEAVKKSLDESPEASASAAQAVLPETDDGDGESAKAIHANQHPEFLLGRSLPKVT